MSIEQTEAFFCPYCGSENSLAIDITGGPRQNFVVDCESCCGPLAVHLKISGREVISLEVRRENE